MSQLFEIVKVIFFLFYITFSKCKAKQDYERAYLNLSLFQKVYCGSPNIIAQIKEETI